MLQWYLSISWVSYLSFPDGLRSPHIPVPIEMFFLPLIFLTVVTTVAYTSPMPQCPAVGAVIGLRSIWYYGYIGSAVHDVTRAKFSPAETIPLQVVYVGHS